MNYTDTHAASDDQIATADDWAEIQALRDSGELFDDVEFAPMDMMEAIARRDRIAAEIQPGYDFANDVFDALEVLRHPIIADDIAKQGTLCGIIPVIV